MPRCQHAVPADQPHSVHQIAERLFRAYTIDGGGVRLAGCLLDDRLFLRLEFEHGGARRSLLIDADGRQPHPALLDQLGLDCLKSVDRPPRRCEAEVAPLLEAGRRLAEHSFVGPPGELVGVTAVWVKFADGKLRFTIGESSAELPFSGWARTLEPPPFVCPLTGAATFHLAATDDGRIVAAEQIAACAESGRRVLADELVKCEITGKQVLAELASLCPVSNQRVLARLMVECATCHQRVAPAAAEHGQCHACRNLAAVGADDPRMARLLHEHPDWERWGSWRLAETATVYILSAARWLKRVLMVVDRQTLELKTLAVGSRIFGGWESVPADQQTLVLSE